MIADPLRVVTARKAKEMEKLASRSESFNCITTAALLDRIINTVAREINKETSNNG